MSECYNRLLQLIESKGMSRSEFCKLSGITTQRLSELKNGKKKQLNANELIKTAKALDISLDEAVSVNSLYEEIDDLLHKLSAQKEEVEMKAPTIDFALTGDVLEDFELTPEEETKAQMGHLNAKNTNFAIRTEIPILANAETERELKRLELFDLSKDAPAELLDSLLTVLRLNKRKTDEKTS